MYSNTICAGFSNHDILVNEYDRYYCLLRFAIKLLLVQFLYLIIK
jgi:hypothetical protein